MALSLPRDAASVAVGRQVLSGCLEVLGVTPATRSDIALALGEACANVIQHAYGGGEGHIEVDLAMVDGDVEVTVRDTGRWRSISPHGGGRGLDLMRGLMDTVEVDTGPDGTVVRMRRRVRKEADERAGAH